MNCCPFYPDNQQPSGKKSLFLFLLFTNKVTFERAELTKLRAEVAREIQNVPSLRPSDFRAGETNVVLSLLRAKPNEFMQISHLRLFGKTSLTSLDKLQSSPPSSREDGISSHTAKALPLETMTKVLRCIRTRNVFHKTQTPRGIIISNLAHKKALQRALATHLHSHTSSVENWKQHKLKK